MTRTEITAILKPETPLEASFLQDDGFCRGLLWGVPRYGHPEGTILAHIVEVNANVDALPVDAETRRKLRVVTFVHDTFKNIEHKGNPRDWTKHHAVYARQFLARYCDDEYLLNLVELHDDAYYAWRMAHLYHRFAECEARIEAIRERIGPYWQLFYLFFKCDTATGDKNPAPLIWFEETMKGIEVVEFETVG
ncbi:hypothetical protein [Neolewinella antarctica]|uniref:HD domain-containing protein n=1 Tax=Neolewinella antarctica TaxID=442734 RepID=A0ABX0XBQ2_9BACT|nr:hypothetical protein [Neolewinella antarctica]NJC26708.1 hypothetical protein [Neolewinella antarctica]